MKLLKQNALKNVSWVLFTKVISMGLFLLIDLLIARILGKAMYGEWAFFYSILTMYYYVYWFGVNQSSKVLVAKTNQKDEKLIVIKTSFCLRIIVSLFFMIIFFILSEFIATKLGYPEKYPFLLTLLKLGSIIAFANSFIEYTKQMNMGLKKFKHFFLSSFFEYFLILVCVVFFMFFSDKGIYSVGKGYLVGYIIAAVAAVYLLVKESLKLKIDKDIMKKVFVTAVPLSLLGVGGMLMMEMDTFMLGLMTLKEEVALYSIAKSLTSKASQVNYSITCGTIQDFAVLTEENVEKKYKQFKKVVNWNLLCTLLICVFFLCFSKLALSLIYGQEYEEGFLMIYILLPYYFLTSVSNLYSNFLDFHGKSKYRLVWYTIAIVLNLVLNCIFISQMGAFGAAIASGISLLPYTIALIVMSRKVFNSYVT